jgi:hypothetical protein
MLGEAEMDIGAGVAIVGVAVSGAAVLIKVIGNGKDIHTKCLQHAAIEAKQADFDAWLQKIERKLDTVIAGRRQGDI